MRTHYIVLFFIGTASLVGLSWLFLLKMDKGGKAWLLALIFSGIIASVLLLILLLKKYFRQPTGKRRH